MNMCGTSIKILRVSALFWSMLLDRARRLVYTDAAGEGLPGVSFSAWNDGTAVPAFGCFQTGYILSRIKGVDMIASKILFYLCFTEF